MGPKQTCRQPSVSKKRREVLKIPDQISREGFKAIFSLQGANCSQLGQPVQEEGILETNKRLSLYSFQNDILIGIGLFWKIANQIKHIGISCS